MRTLPAINDTVKLFENQQQALVRHVLPEQNMVKLVKVNGKGEFVSIGYHHIHTFKKTGSLMVA